MNEFDLLIVKNVFGNKRVSYLFFLLLLVSVLVNPFSTGIVVLVEILYSWRSVSKRHEHWAIKPTLIVGYIKALSLITLPVVILCESLFFLSRFI